MHEDGCGHAEVLLAVQDARDEITLLHALEVDDEDLVAVVADMHPRRAHRSHKGFRRQRRGRLEFALLEHRDLLRVRRVVDVERTFLEHAQDVRVSGRATRALGVATAATQEDGECGYEKNF